MQIETKNSPAHPVSAEDDPEIAFTRQETEIYEQDSFELFICRDPSAIKTMEEIANCNKLSTEAYIFENEPRIYSLQEVLNRLSVGAHVHVKLGSRAESITLLQTTHDLTNWWVREKNAQLL